MKTHTCSKNHHVDWETQIGNEMVTFRDWICLCGKTLSREVIARRKL